MAAQLTPTQIAQAAAFFANSAYVATNVTATNASDVLATAIGAIDAAVSVSISAGSASASVSVSLVGNFTAAQLEQLMAYVLLKRAGVI